jgi:probable rRNA maturation factor
VTTVTLHNRQRSRRLYLSALRRFAAHATAVIPLRQTEVSVTFVSDTKIAGMNKEYHATAGPTDILTFDYGATGELIISADHAWANAHRYRTAPGREVRLYIVHGLLHLAGYRDATPAQRRRMRAAERRVLRAIGA